MISEALLHDLGFPPRNEHEEYYSIDIVGMSLVYDPETEQGIFYTRDDGVILKSLEEFTNAYNFMHELAEKRDDLDFDELLGVKRFHDRNGTLTAQQLHDEIEDMIGRLDEHNCLLTGLPVRMLYTSDIAKILSKIKKLK